jgi:hypothetical protein
VTPEKRIDAQAASVISPFPPDPASPSIVVDAGEIQIFGEDSLWKLERLEQEISHKRSQNGH